MALVMSFTDSSGNTAASSYWMGDVININGRTGAITLVFNGWKDQASYASSLAPLTGAVKSYLVTGTDFTAVAAQTPVGSTLHDVLAHAVEAYALAKLDTNGKSFFDGASQV